MRKKTIMTQIKSTKKETTIKQTWSTSEAEMYSQHKFYKAVFT